jgi:hypothetical protein
MFRYQGKTGQVELIDSSLVPFITLPIAASFIFSFSRGKLFPISVNIFYDLVNELNDPFLIIITPAQ